MFGQQCMEEGGQGEGEEGGRDYLSEIEQLVIHDL